jgi:hypothetical protein
VLHHWEYCFGTSLDGKTLVSAREILKMEEGQGYRPLKLSAYSLPKEEVSRLGSRA